MDRSGLLRVFATGAAVLFPGAAQGATLVTLGAGFTVTIGPVVRPGAELSIGFRSGEFPLPHRWDQAEPESSLTLGAVARGRWEGDRRLAVSAALRGGTAIPRWETAPTSDSGGSFTNPLFLAEGEAGLRWRPGGGFAALAGLGGEVTTWNFEEYWCYFLEYEPQAGRFGLGSHLSVEFLAGDPELVFGVGGDWNLAGLEATNLCF